MFLVRCPFCRNSMRVDPRVDVSKAKKRCVYCGKTFSIHPNIKDSRIVKEL